MRGKQAIYGDWGALFNDQTAVKPTIDFLFKYTAQLKIQLIKRRLQIAVVDLNTPGKLCNVGTAAGSASSSSLSWEMRLHGYSSLSPHEFLLRLLFNLSCDSQNNVLNFKLWKHKIKLIRRKQQQNNADLLMHNAQ